MDPRKAQVVTGPQARHDQVLFGASGSWFFDHRFDFVNVVAIASSDSTNRSEERQPVFASFLNRGHDAIFLTGQFDDLPGTTFFSMTDVDVVAYQVQEGFVGDKVPGPIEGITCLLYTSPSPRDATLSRMPSSA